MGLFGALHVVIFRDLDFFRKVFAGFFEVEWVRKVDNWVIFGVKEENLAIDFSDGVLDFDSKRVEFGLGGEVIFQVAEKGFEEKFGDEGFFGGDFEGHFLEWTERAIEYDCADFGVEK